MSTWVEEYHTMCEDCEEREERLTEWEHDFITDIKERLEKKEPRPLSGRQIEMLCSIWERATEKG